MSAFITQQNNFVQPQGNPKGYFPPPTGIKPKGMGLPPSGPSSVVINSRRQSARNRSSRYNQDLGKAVLNNRFSGNSSQSKLQLPTAIGQHRHSQNSLDVVREGSFAHIYPGTLPTLGLNKFKNVDLLLNQSNPYKVQDATEKLLVSREREREFSGFNKFLIIVFATTYAVDDSS